MAVDAGAALRCDDLEQAVLAAQTLLLDPVALEQTRGRALHWSQAHRGATARTVAALATYLG
jgi:3-deoxy-D-manno-octulosonic-acid transferase